MSSHFQFTVPEAKEDSNIQIKRIAQSHAKEIEVISTKDGTVYMLEFDTDFQKKTFEADLNKKFPLLFY